ncbi:response regulator transcription factor [Dehalococcoides mccartyi]|uniref:DNA-binding response regulator n=1 Tax=Dehalococcoides mccartyi (strain CBDB1) TaxID=255470 RepID=A0A916NZK3_DEHMC|nr:response regulator transcription factor [Dehalococcoides mccartyi]CAI83521.1 DNA-binding response regulator [Dehalococcoides mccartyi CBDB1]
MNKILIIEDDLKTADAFSSIFRLTWPDAEIMVTSNGEQGIQKIEDQQPEIVILDIGLPDISGFDVIREVRRFTDVPIIVITARTDELDVVKALELGANDFISKPPRKMELIARIKALIRKKTIDDFSFGNISFDKTQRTINIKDKKISLSVYESLLFEKLILAAPNTATYAQLTECLWGEDNEENIKKLKVHIQYLRAKIEKAANTSSIIVNRSGLGYFLRNP